MTKYVNPSTRINGRDVIMVPPRNNGGGGSVSVDLDDALPLETARAYLQNTFTTPDTANMYPITECQLAITVSDVDRKVKVTSSAYIYNNNTTNNYHWMGLESNVSGSWEQFGGQAISSVHGPEGRYGQLFNEAWLDVPAGASVSVRPIVRMYEAAASISPNSNSTWCEWVAFPASFGQGETGSKGDKGDKGDTGATGPSGEPKYAGAGEPGLLVGFPGEVYLDTTTGDLWVSDGPDGWTQSGNIKGPQGDQGDIGPQGDGALVDEGDYDNPPVELLAGEFLYDPTAEPDPIYAALTQEQGDARYEPLGAVAPVEKVTTVTDSQYTDGNGIMLTRFGSIVTAHIDLILPVEGSTPQPDAVIPLGYRPMINTLALMNTSYGGTSPDRESVALAFYTGSGVINNFTTATGCKALRGNASWRTEDEYPA